MSKREMFKDNRHVQKLLQTIYTDTNFLALQDFIQTKSAKNIFSLSEAIPYIGLAFNQVNNSILVVKNDVEAEQIAVSLQEFLGDKVAFFPAWETLPHERISPSLVTMGRRLQVLAQLQKDPQKIGVLVCSVSSLLQPIYPSAKSLEGIELQVGKEVDFTETVQQIQQLGFNRVDMVTQRGEFAVRGGIIDIFPSVHDVPLRIEFWGDEITDIRKFSIANQLTIMEDKLSKLHIFPTREVLLTEPLQEKLAELLSVYQDYPVISDMLAQASQGIYVNGIEALAPLLFAGETQSVLNFFPPRSPIVLVEPTLLKNQLEELNRANQEFLDSAWEFGLSDKKAPVDLRNFLTEADYTYTSIEKRLIASEHRLFTVSALSESAETSNSFNFNFTGVQKLLSPAYKPEELLSLISERITQSKLTVLSVGNELIAKRWQNNFKKAGVTAILADKEKEFNPNTLNIITSVVNTSVYLPSSDFLLLVESNLTGKRKSSPRKHKTAAARGKVDPVTLLPGDYVVHEQYGVGIFKELLVRQVGGVQREYLVLEYAPNKRGHAGDKLYVPMDSINQLSKYIGGQAPVLSRLGSQDWQNTKNKARKAVQAIAEELVKLYAARTAIKGHAFSADTPWQTELEDNFEYVETFDQLEAIKAVKADMEKSTPMDRVIVGDVGYGKTEIAVRAAFKAIQDGKQVAVLVPTTLLAQQHYQTFLQRTNGFPVKLATLSRFSTAKEAKELVNNIAKGEVDLVIGTHRLLQQDIKWKDLGLVIIDEEQRFGVQHKEYIKSLRTHVDVLTMSATPIPRTLEMSLVGIREMSTILTPPEERLPVLTYVGEYDDKQVKAVINRELLRGGQVFYIHNRVSTIDKAAKHLKELVPNARFAVAHGKLTEDVLEQTVTSFWNKEYDVLICTTIVETGLDITNANTLIVEDATKLGLSQLHQLRGRVGRSGERGYAYFLYPPHSNLTQTAYDRLVTIAQNNELGAGMSVALKDLELRGAGNVLGMEQSGHIAGVGFDLYVRLVGEAVSAFKALQDEAPLPVTKPLDLRIELTVDAHIPLDYVASERLRLEAYKKIADTNSKPALLQVFEELQDRYGKLPPAVLRVGSVSLLRNIAASLGVKEILQVKDKIKITNVRLLDSQQVRLSRLYPKAQFRPGFASLLLPIPKEEGKFITNESLLKYLADFFQAIFPDESVDYEVILNI